MKFSRQLLAVTALALLGATSQAAPTFVNGLTVDGDTLDASGGVLVNDGRLGFFSDIYYDPLRNDWWALSDRGPGGGTLDYEVRVHRFTIGQRKGLGVSSSVPLYVLRIEAESGQVTVGPREALEQRSLTAATVTWTGADVPHEWRAVRAQIRHRHRPAAGRVRALPDGRAAFESDEPLSAVTPGQAAVFYDGDLVVGGGWIEQGM